MNFPWGEIRLYFYTHIYFIILQQTLTFRRRWTGRRFPGVWAWNWVAGCWMWAKLQSVALKTGSLTPCLIPESNERRDEEATLHLQHNTVRYTLVFNLYPQNIVDIKALRFPDLPAVSPTVDIWSSQRSPWSWRCWGRPVWRPPDVNIAQEKETRFNLTIKEICLN